MNAIRFITLLHTTVALLFATTTVSHGTTVVFSNLVPEAEGGSHLLKDSAGSPLAVGSWIGLGRFGSMDSTAIAALAQQGNSALMAAFVPFGAPSAIGTGSANAEGRVEFAGNVANTDPLGGIHVVAFNGASPETATEVLIVSLPGLVPPDDPSGLIGYLAMHLESATLVFGGSQGGGFSTAAFQGGFDSWMEGLGLGNLPGDLSLPGSDADHDGIANLVEYALGSHAGQAGSLATTALVEENGVFRIRFLCRNDDPALSVIVETSADLDLGSWSPVPQPPSVMPVPPSPAPPGYDWLEAEIPTVGNKRFARVRVSQ